MSLALDARMLAATDPVRQLGAKLERMIAVQMAAYPSGWTEEEKREMAEQHLFGDGARKEREL